MHLHKKKVNATLQKKKAPNGTINCISEKAIVRVLTVKRILDSQGTGNKRRYTRWDHNLLKEIIGHQ